MKIITKTFAIILCVSIYAKSYAQTYRNAYNAVDRAVNNGNGFSFWINKYDYNLGYVLHNGASVLESYLVMFKATHDKKYLDKFILHAKQ